MKIEYPTTEEVDHAILTTIQKAYPKKENALVYLIKLYRQIGLEFLMQGIKEIFLGIILTYLLMFFWRSGTEMNMDNHTFLFVTVFSPIVFQTILVLSIIGKKEQHVYELEMTCKYTVHHVLLLRMFLTSGFCTLCNAGACIVVFKGEGMADILHMVFLSATALFAYSLLYLILLLRSSMWKHQVILYLVWSVGNILAAILFPTCYTFLAIDIPLIYHGIIWLLFAVLFCRKLNQYLYYNCKYNLYVGE